MKVLALLAISLLLVSGCSSTPESKPEYDELELIIWEKCMDTIVGDITFSEFLSKREILDAAMDYCKDLRPIKRS